MELTTVFLQFGIVFGIIRDQYCLMCPPGDFWPATGTSQQCVLCTQVWYGMCSFASAVSYRLRSGPRSD